MLAQFNLDEFSRDPSNVDGMASMLSAHLFASEAVARFFRTARDAATSLGIPLRMRLHIAPDAAWLQVLPWELLRDPEDGATLLADDSVLFSRYVSSADLRPVRLVPRASLRALVVAANPSNFSGWAPAGRPLAPLDMPAELARANAGLGQIPSTVLCSGESPGCAGRPTVSSLVAHLEGHEILYLVCHLELADDTPHAWLEDAQGNVDVVSFRDFASLLSGLPEPPRLVLLVAPQGAGDGGWEAISRGGALSAAMGAILTEAGVPAVLAMQGSVTSQTLSQFMPRFFDELWRDGQIDRAMAAARAAARMEGRPDWWVPVLFTRLSGGRILSEPVRQRTSQLHTRAHRECTFGYNGACAQGSAGRIGRFRKIGTGHGCVSRQAHPGRIPRRHPVGDARAKSSCHSRTGG
jgi:hypothetical protein